LSLFFHLVYSLIKLEESCDDSTSTELLVILTT
jgi:hypothetical protein